MQPVSGQDQRVAIAMATRDGRAFIDQQMESLAVQSYPHIDLWISDDGSRDDTVDRVSRWKDRWRKGSLNLVDGPRLGFAENFRSMILDSRIEADFLAFCDQDDIWEPHKLQDAVSWMRSQRQEIPLLFCSRTATISEAGEPIGYSPLFRSPPSFRNALVQSLAGGNTMVMNRVARDLLRQASAKTKFISHDWWAYLIVTAAGGQVFYDARPLVRYRQHGGNQVGANVSWRSRLSRLRRLFEGEFADWTDANLRGLTLNRDILTGDAARTLRLFLRSRKGGFLRRLYYLRKSGVYRQTTLGTLALYLAFVLRRI